MELNGKDLRSLIERIIALVQNELNLQKKNVYVVLTSSWKPQYPAFFQAMSQQNVQLNVVVPPQFSIEREQEIRAWNPECRMIRQEEAVFPSQTPFITIFPTAGRSLVAKIALGMDDTFASEWVRHCFEQGEKVIMLTTGFEPFTGKEPLKYIETILGYYRTLLEYGVRLQSEISLDEEEDQRFPEVLEKTNVADTIKAVQKTTSKRVITAEDLVLAKNGKLILQQGDVVTMLAKERAAQLGIQIQYC